MAAWMGTASFVLLVIIVLILLACLVILIIKLFNTSTGCTGTSVALLSANNNSTPAALTSAAVANVLSLGPNNNAFFGSGADRDAKYENRSELNLTKDAFYNNLTLINSNLNTNGYRLFVAGTLVMDNNSVIQNAGKDGGNNGAFGVGPVPGGLGAKRGTLGGGGNGGNGYLKDGSKTAIHGEPSEGVLWGTNTNLFRGSDATLSAAVSAFGAGEAGTVLTHTSRVQFEAAQALNASFVPTAPMLSGGSGGGGGQGAAQWPGSGGGGGGGVIVIAARNINVAKGGGSINVSGGNAGSVGGNGGPFNSTSGGGGGGGLILLATNSLPESYAGLVYNVGGGLSIDNAGNSIKAGPGRVVNWFQSEVDSNPSQFMMAKNVAKQTFSSGQSLKSVVFQQIDSSSAGIRRDLEGHTFKVEQAGLYMIVAELPLDRDHRGAQGYILKNGEQVVGIKQISGQTISLWSVVPLAVKETFEIQISRNYLPHDPVTLLPNASLHVLLMAPQ